MNVEERFWSRVTKTETCWTHSGSLGSHGYPQATYINGKSVCAHRASWIFTNGPIPDGLWVLHKCNNKLCVRPDHLYLGTHTQNMDDVCRAGHPRRKLTPDDVRMIRTCATSSHVLAKELGVNQRTVWNIRQNVTYRYEGR